jgi:hypothetical protein
VYLLVTTAKLLDDAYRTEKNGDVRERLLLVRHVLVDNEQIARVAENEFHRIKWLIYYYNPLGLKRVWDHDWLFSNFPTASMILWSLTARIVCVTLWIWYQNKQEAEGREFSIQRLSFITKFMTYRPK